MTEPENLSTESQYFEREPAAERCEQIGAQRKVHQLERHQPQQEFLVAEAGRQQLVRVEVLEDVVAALENSRQFTNVSVLVIN